MDKNSQLAILRHAKSAINELNARRKALPGYIAKKTLADSTIRSYESTYRTLMNKVDQSRESLVAAAMDTRVPRTWFKRKAALIYKFQKDLSLIVKDLKNNSSETFHVEKLQEMEKLASLLEQVNTATFEISKSQKPRSQTKKTQLKSLPEDWRESIFIRMPKYRQQIATLILTGCRPSELVKGVKWTIENNLLKAKIMGSKLGIYSGQEERIIAYDDSNRVSKSMFELVRRKGGEFIVETPSSMNLTTAIRSAGKRAFPKHKHSITCYSFRHQLAADMKASGTEGDDISKILGHASARTKAYYGVRKQGNGAMGHIKSVKTTKPIKPLPKSATKFFNNNNISHPYINQLKSNQSASKPRLT